MKRINQIFMFIMSLCLLSTVYVINRRKKQLNYATTGGNLLKRVNQSFLLVLCAGLFSLQITAQTKSTVTKNGDSRVVKALTQAKTKYELDKNGNYKVTFGTQGNRSQSAYISSATDNVYDFELRGVFSFAAFSKTPYSQEITNLLLEQNMVSPSAWAVIKMPDSSFAIVNIMYIPANSDGKKLDSALQNVISLSDEMEERLTKEDKL